MSTTPARISRRTFFQGSVLLAGTALAIPALSACTSSEQTPPRGYDGQPRQLPIPPLYDGELVEGVRVFSLSPQAGEANILPEQKSKTWGFNGPHLGPTLRARRGETVRVNIHNQLPEMTTIHWHGMKLPAIADGGPHSPIEPGATWHPEWTVNQPAATLWYHPHPHERTALHCYRGLAGVFLLDDEVEANLDLPRNYGVDDIPVVLTDAKFQADGNLDEEIDPVLGLMGTTPCVNGITNAKFSATTKRLRLRIVNGASMRFYHLRLDNGESMQIIASDAGLLPAPVEVDTLLLSPGERAEVIVEVEAGENIRLQSVPVEDNFGIPQGENFDDFGFQDTFDLLLIEPAANLDPAPALPQVLDAKAEADPRTTGVFTRDFQLNTFLINGQSMDMSRVDVVIDHQDPEIWTVTNENADWPHNFHIHNARFKVLSLNGAATENVWHSGWKDTIALPPGAVAELGVEFGWYPDPTIPYMYHCHMLLHEDQGMMGQFVVAEPGAKIELIDTGAHADHGGHHGDDEHDEHDEHDSRGS